MFSFTSFLFTLLIGLLFFGIGLLIGWLLWRNCRQEDATMLESENEQLRGEQVRLRREILEVETEIKAAV